MKASLFKGGVLIADVFSLFKFIFFYKIKLLLIDEFSFFKGGILKLLLLLI